MSEECTVYMSEELIINILKRLPVNSLLRFISVCKSWYSLIKSPDFISAHLDHFTAASNSITGARYLLYLDFGHVDRYYLHSDNAHFSRHMRFSSPYGFRVVRVGFCNGVVCLGHNVQPSLVLWNPSLRKTLDLNVPYSIDSDETFSHGFGFDSSSNDYKVVSIAHSRYTNVGTKLKGVYVYSLKAGAWKRIDARFSCSGESIICFKGVHVNGVVHWLVEKRGGFSVKPVSILTFDLADEILEEIPVPENMGDNKFLPDYMVLMSFPSRDTGQERLAHLQAASGHCNIWLRGFNDGIDSWRLIYSVKCYTVEIERFVNVRKNGEIVVKLKHRNMAFLDVQDMSFKSIADENLDYVGTYVESLVLV